MQSPHAGLNRGRVMTGLRIDRSRARMRIEHAPIPPPVPGYSCPGLAVVLLRRTAMGLNNQHRTVYLNDHLAGSSAAFEVLEVLAEVRGLEDWVRHIRDEIAQDRHELEKLMSSLEIARGSVRQAAGWLTGRIAELKTHLDDRKGGDLKRLELLETLALGIEGKRSMWAALQSASADDEALRGPDYARLIARAVEQRQEVEVRRLKAAADALGSRQP